MYLLTVVFGPSPVPWAFMFHKRELVEAAFAALTASNPSVAKITDEFGQCAMINPAQIHGVMLEDMEQSKLAQIERGLHQARTQARANQQAMSDPVLKAAAAMQGPAVLNPVNGRFPQ